MRVTVESTLMRDFDDFERTDSAPRKHNESVFDFYNRSGWARCARIRNLLEEWFGHYPPEHQKDIWSRLRRKDEDPFSTAFFELFLHELMRRQGQVTIHPEADWGTSKRVDFRVQPRNSEAFLLEATTFHRDSKAEQNAEIGIRAICETIDQVESPNFWLCVEIDGKASQQLSLKELRQFLEKKLRELEDDESRSNEPNKQFETWLYTRHGLTLTFTPMPKSKLRAKPGVGTLGSRSGPDSFGFSTVVRDLRGHLKRKGKKYGAPSLPLIIAINVIDWMYQGHQELAQALFGTVREAARVSFPEGQEPLVESFLKQEKDGLLFDGKDPHYREVSGVLVFSSTAPWSLGVVTSRLFLNPWAIHPLAASLRDFPRTFAENGTLAHESGKSVAEMLGLPANWPGDE
jgi:hypothetical protein